MSFPAAVTEEIRAIRPYCKFEGHTDEVRGVIHLSGEQRIITCSLDGSLRVWNLKTGKQIGNDWRDGESDVYTIALSLDGKKVVSGSHDAAVRLWDVDMGKVIAKWTGHNTEVWCICWSRDSGRIVSGDGEGAVRVWDVESGKTVLVNETGPSGVHTVIYSPDTTMIATGGSMREEYLRIWDAKTGKLVANLKGHTSYVNCLAWTADGKTLISGSEDSSIRTWNATTWQQVAVWTGHTDTVLGIAISPNGRILASASWDNTARLWNLENGQPIGSPLQHTVGVDCVSFSTDGKQLATGCGDNSAYTWDISAIVEEAGLSELLSRNGKSLLDADPTRPRGDWRRNPYPGPSNDSPHQHQLSTRHSLYPSSARRQGVSAHLSLHERVPPDRISLPLRRNNDNTDDTPTQPHLLAWARNLLFSTRNRRNEERLPAVVHVPLAQATQRNSSAIEVRRKRRKEREEARKAREKQKARDANNANNTKSASAVTSRSSQNNVTQQPGRATLTHPTPELLSAGVSTSPTTPAIAPTSVGTACCIRFWSAACCASAQNSDGHH